MVEIRVRYEGGLRCHATHGPSDAALDTDAPVDNQGRGESFSPTDLVATAHATCMLTILGIVAERDGRSIEGASATIEKEMVADPQRRIGRLVVEIAIPGEWNPQSRARLEEAARTCPVALSLNPAIEASVHFVWG